MSLLGKREREEIEEEEEDTCPICLEKLSDTTNGQVVETRCGHTFHKNCIENISGNRCPICRRPAFPTTLVKTPAKGGRTTIRRRRKQRTNKSKNKRKNKSKNKSKTQQKRNKTNKRK